MTVRSVIASVIGAFLITACTSDPAPAPTVEQTTQAVQEDPAVEVFVRYWKVVHRVDVSPRPPEADSPVDPVTALVHMGYAESPVPDKACATGALMDWVIRGGGRTVTATRDEAVNAARWVITDPAHQFRFVQGLDTGECPDFRR